MLRAAIFDLDGLLVDSEPLWQQAEMEVFAGVGLRLTREEARQTLGLRSDEVVRRRFEQQPWDAASRPLAEVEGDIIDRVIGLLRTEGRAMKGVDHALEFVEEKGLTLALASSSRRSIIDAALEVLGLRHRFQVVYSAESEPHGKPHPGVYLSTAGRLGIEPRECVAFEDSLAGLTAAAAAGMACVVVPDAAVVGRPELEGADLVLSSLADLDERAWRRLVARNRPPRP